MSRAESRDGSGDGWRVARGHYSNTIIVAASSLLIKDIALSNYQSHDFPSIVFNGKVAGEVYIINGHHRIAAWKQVHKDLILQATGI